VSRDPRPKPGPIFIVRWTRIGGRPTHRFFLMEGWARKLVAALEENGNEVEMFTTTTRWTRVPTEEDPW
jgi:hypothetical protein